MSRTPKLRYKCLTDEQAEEMMGTAVVVVGDGEAEPESESIKTLRTLLDMIDLSEVGSFFSLGGRNFFRPRESSLKAVVHRDGIVITYPSIIKGDNEVRIFVPDVTDVDSDDSKQLADILDSHFASGSEKRDARFVSKDYDRRLQDAWEDDSVTFTFLLKDAVAESFGLSDNTPKNALARRVALVQLLSRQISLDEMLALSVQEIIELDPERKAQKLKSTFKAKLPEKPKASTKKSQPKASQLKGSMKSRASGVTDKEEALTAAIAAVYPLFKKSLSAEIDLSSYTEDEIRTAFWKFLSA